MTSKALKRSPVAAFSIMLAVIFIAEVLLTAALDHLLPTTMPRWHWLAILIDAVPLTIIAAIAVWLLYMRPLKESLIGEAGRARAITDAAAEGIVTIDAYGTVESCNPSAVQLFGYTDEDEIIGKNVKILMPEPYSSAHDGYIEHHLNTGEKRIIGRPREVVARQKDGTLIPVELNVAEIKLGSDRHFTGIFRDVTERKIHEAKMQHMAHYDALTELPNRVLFYDRLRQAINMAKREKNQLAICYLDLDGFKAVNDTLGHDKGDELLKSAALRLKHVIRESDTVARLGGDEFAVILPHITHHNDAVLVAEKIIDTLGAPFQLHDCDQPVHIGVSVGIAIFPHHADTLDKLVKMADTAMYNAKRVGNRFQFPAGNPVHTTTS